jgi:hypothetical protein
LFKITKGLSLAHGSQKRLILVTLWQLPPSQFGQVPLANHTKPFQQLAWLQRFFKNQPCQGLSSNPCCSRRHPENKDYQAIWLVRVFVHAIWAI